MKDIKYYGLDVGKRELHTAYKHTSKAGKLKVKHRQFTNDTKGVMRLIKWLNKPLKGNQIPQIVMEATGSYHELAATRPGAR